MDIRNTLKETIKKKKILSQQIDKIQSNFKLNGQIRKHLLANNVGIIRMQNNCSSLINKYVVFGKISYEDETRCESRRIDNQKKGINGEIIGSGLCFKCSSTEHTSSRYHQTFVVYIGFSIFVYISIYYFSGGSCNLYGCPLVKLLIVVKQVWCYIRIIETT
ncbi:unnamed protein product [Brugia timori]|uniref:Transmembrane protein n=1 Tax=Brugia timori TaxID=42155 RepID=A0A0R3QKP6_9BILA|nr:unnamed protein product [Brugia timori]